MPDAANAAHTSEQSAGSKTATELQAETTPQRDRYDAVVVGSGPNGLAAANVIAEAGRSVLVVEAADTIGGATRSAELTLPGFIHDVCSAVHPLGIASPLFRQWPLEQFGLEWCHAPLPLAHPVSGDQAVAVHQSLDATAEGLGSDGPIYRKRLAPFINAAEELLAQILGPLRWPEHPLLMTRFACWGWQSAERFARRHFRETPTAGMFAGMAAHSVLPLNQCLTAGVGLMFCVTAHAAGWPLPRGGSQRIADALAKRLLHLGGEIVVSRRVRRLDELPPSQAVLFDTNPRQLSRIAGNALPSRYRQTLERFRHGPGVFKVDWALDGPIPWSAEACHRAGTVHVGGTFEEIAQSERSAWSSQPAERPFVLVAQPTRFDESRAPRGKHTAWAYCHVPHGCTVDMTAAIEAQIERFAPGFGQRILQRHTISPTQLEQRNPNCVGGDITGGVMDLRQLFTRPAARLVPYTTPNPRLLICSASTPPGGGVHGMCGYFAAQAALRGPLAETGRHGQ